MKTRRLLAGLVALLLVLAFVWWHFPRKPHPPLDPRWGSAIDSYQNVTVYFNGSVGTTNGRNTAPDGYNLGMKYQCVEFVKRFYYEHLHHKMPDSYGNARDFFDSTVRDGARNAKRDLTQYTNPSSSQPRVDDLVVLDGTEFNRYGHVAIICAVAEHELTLIQQNPGPSRPSRVAMAVKLTDGKWHIENPRVLGWLRKP